VGAPAAAAPSAAPSDAAANAPADAPASAPTPAMAPAPAPLSDQPSLSAVAAPKAAKMRTLQINTLAKGQLFGEIGVLQAVPRTASVIAERACEIFVMPRIEMMRFFFDMPALRAELYNWMDRYPTDEDLVRTWRADDYWHAYKRGMIEGVKREQPEIKRPAYARINLSLQSHPSPLIWHNLPRHNLPLSARGPQPRAIIEDDEDTTRYLDTHVLPKEIFESLKLDTTRPVQKELAPMHKANRQVMLKRSTTVKFKVG